MPRLRDPDSRALARRAQILAEARRVFGEKGYHATSIADIALGLGLGHGTFYRYFKNKLDILGAVVDEIIGAVTSLVEDEGANAADDLETYRAQLERIGSRFFLIFEENRRIARLVFREAFLVDPVVAERMRLAMDLFASFTEAYLENGKAKGFLREDIDAHVAARAINAMILESVEHVGRSADPKDMSARWQRTVISLMLDGMRARG